jgi:hypothetical protein
MKRATSAITDGITLAWQSPVGVVSNVVEAWRAIRRLLW